ncbi:hypothetical protein FD08_GL004042 [Lentilactobacillus parakefiri DSM 10551]|nr:hypothetical protein FD08_GL004042 [Lentilactobacillus parakefiri DSM 10551]
MANIYLDKLTLDGGRKMNSIWNYWRKLNIKSTELIGVAVGAFIYSMTYNYLLLPSHLGEGGAMGITALL